MAPPPHILVFLSISLSIAAVAGQPWMGFYSLSCPLAETIVRNTVESHFKQDHTVAPALLRLHFHDCFVRGCDASILLDGLSTEKTAPANLGVRGYEVIDDAKSQLEKECPGIVSCADIVAIAARDSVHLSNGPWYPVTTGRRDGRVSIASEVGENLPSPFDSIDVQKKKFKAKGLSTVDLVSLAGAHTIGETSCLFIMNRLYNYTGKGDADPTMEPNFLAQMKNICPKNGDVTRRVALDSGSDTIFDLSFYRNVMNGRVVLNSDQLLWSDASTRDLVRRFLMFGFDMDFGISMVKMGNVDVKTGSVGEIRKICSVINS